MHNGKTPSELTGRMPALVRSLCSTGRQHLNGNTLSSLFIKALLFSFLSLEVVTPNDLRTKGYQHFYQNGRNESMRYNYEHMFPRIWFIK